MRLPLTQPRTAKNRNNAPCRSCSGFLLPCMKGTVLPRVGSGGIIGPTAMNSSNVSNANIQRPMNSTSKPDSNRTTRREFLKTSGTALAGAALASAIARPGYAAENNTIKIALVGCGGRGSGAAAQALSTPGPTKLWAMADVFEHRLQGSLALLKQDHEKQLDVPPERQFIGLDGFKKAIDSLDKRSEEHTSEL